MPIILTHCSAHKIKKKFRKWCGCGDLGTCDSTDHGTAYIATDYNTGMGKGFYDIIVYLRHYPISQFEVPNNNSKTWDNFKNGSNNYMLWKSAILYGPNVPGRDGNFQTGHNDTPGHLHIGTIGVEVIRTEWNCDDNVMERKTIWWALWDFHKGWRGPNNWGNEWLRCGHELDFWFRDYADWRHQK
ncbi:hypothetical protein J4772_13580 [Cohnella sp. LGH]|uniref:hypothetical protein n=1 Tax=Cohnella sp. LGH TaxID=1619153 RepID=UPI001AD9F25D|nr:hypothetical protein [Cohnella sp. LGH]QTH45343.1 hypothetical protein J4772_13580 [Cohnella sp. LGH]